MLHGTVVTAVIPSPAYCPLSDVHTKHVVNRPGTLGRESASVMIWSTQRPTRVEGRGDEADVIPRHVVVYYAVYIKVASSSSTCILFYVGLLQGRCWTEHLWRPNSTSSSKRPISSIRHTTNAQHATADLAPQFSSILPRGSSAEVSAGSSDFYATVGILPSPRRSAVAKCRPI